MLSIIRHLLLSKTDIIFHKRTKQWFNTQASFTWWLRGKNSFGLRWRWKRSCYSRTSVNSEKRRGTVFARFKNSTSISLSHFQLANTPTLVVIGPWLYQITGSVTPTAKSMDSSQAVNQGFLKNGLVFLMLLCTGSTWQCLVHIGLSNKTSRGETAFN